MLNDIMNVNYFLKKIILNYYLKIKNKIKKNSSTPIFVKNLF